MPAYVLPAIFGGLTFVILVGGCIFFLVRTPKAARRLADGNTNLALNESERQTALQNLGTATQVQMLSRNVSGGS
ncbi:MAG TPA: hypothetical protein VGF80_13605 [Galbitalea sp.]|jgi:hypothetical protein